MCRDQVILDRLTADEVLLDDPLDNIGRTRMIPSAIGVDDGDRPAVAKAKAIRLCAIYASVIGQSELIKASLQVFP